MVDPIQTPFSGEHDLGLGFVYKSTVYRFKEKPKRYTLDATWVITTDLGSGRWLIKALNQNKNRESSMKTKTGQF